VKKFLCIAIYSLLAFNLTGCAFFKSATPAGKSKAAKAKEAAQEYSGQQAKIAIEDFDIQAAKASSEIAAGLREMLVAALLDSKRFSVAERQIKNSDLIISVSVVEFEPLTSGGRAGIGGGGGVRSGVLGGLLGATLNKAHMALDIRIIDTGNSEIIASTRVQGQASDVTGAIMAGFFNGWTLAGGLSAYANTPMEKAIRICIIETVRYISQAIPASYYKYDEGTPIASDENQRDARDS
jgi:curli biogenesis system outer membrane secretion channel CsgG